MPSLSKKSLSFLVLVGAVILGLLFSVYYVYLSPSGLRARENSDLRKAEPDEVVRYTDLEGNDTDLASFKSDLLVINVWASWSPFTAKDHEILAQIKREFGDRVTIRAVNRMESKETARAYLDVIGSHDGIEYVLDTTDHLYTSQGSYAMPETLIYNKIGNTVLHIRGTLSYDALRANLMELLKKE